MPDFRRMFSELYRVELPERECPKKYTLPWKAKAGELQEVPWIGTEKRTIELQIEAIRGSYLNIFGTATVGLACALPVIFLWKEGPPHWFFWYVSLPFVLVAMGCSVGALQKIINLPNFNATARQRLNILASELPKAQSRDEAREVEYQARVESAFEDRRQHLKQLSHWLDMDGHTFEIEFARLLARHYWSVEVTKASGDGGIDIQGADAGGRSVAIQCKRWNKKIGSPAVKDLRGAGFSKFDRLIVIGTGGFTRSATTFAEENGIELWDTDHLETLLFKEP